MSDKNYYEILQIDKNASKEIMDKAYKTLIKKYHPDLQQGKIKEQYEEIIKEINEAYEILSDNEKRQEYNKIIEKNSISQENFEKLYTENQQLKQELNNTYSYITQHYYNNKNTENNISNNIPNKISDDDINSIYEQRINEAINNAYQKAYRDAYIQDLKNRGYKIKYKKTFKDILKDIFTFIITILFIFLFFNLPFIKNHVNTFISLLKSK